VSGRERVRVTHVVVFTNVAIVVAIVVGVVGIEDGISSSRAQGGGLEEWRPACTIGCKGGIVPRRA
jgi:hypothetical protein